MRYVRWLILKGPTLKAGYHKPAIASKSSFLRPATIGNRDGRLRAYADNLAGVLEAA